MLQKTLIASIKLQYKIYIQYIERIRLYFQSEKYLKHFFS